MSAPALERSFRGHRNAVTGAAFHPSLTQVASSSADGCVMVWNFKATMRAFRFVGHRGAVTSVAFNSQGSLIVSGSADTTIRLWIPTVKGESSIIKAHSAAVRSVDFSADGTQIVTCSDDKSVKLWSTSTQRFALSFPGHQNWARTARLSPDGRLCASGGDDKAVFIWDPLSRKATHGFYDHTDAVTCVAFHPDGNCVAAGSADRTINMWDLRMNQLLQHYDAHSDVVNGLSFHPSGHWLLSGSADASAKLWDVREGLLYCTVNAHEGGMNDARFSPCGSQFVTSGRDGLVMVWSSNVDQGAAKGPSAALGASAAAASRYVDPTNTIMSPPHRRAASRADSPSGNVRQPLNQSAGINQGKNNSTKQKSAVMEEPTMVPPMDAPRPRSARLAPSKVSHPRSVATVEPELPVEQLLRQVDISAQTQKILETRLVHTENAQRLLSDSVRDRDTRMSEQIEALKSQLAALHGESSEQRKDIAMLTQTVSRQEDLIRALMEQQRALIDALSKPKE